MLPILELFFYEGGMHFIGLLLSFFWLPLFASAPIKPQSFFSEFAKPWMPHGTFYVDIIERPTHPDFDLAGVAGHKQGTYYIEVVVSNLSPIKDFYVVFNKNTNHTPTQASYVQTQKEWVTRSLAPKVVYLGQDFHHRDRFLIKVSRQFFEPFLLDLYVKTGGKQFALENAKINAKPGCLGLLF